MTKAEYPKWMTAEQATQLKTDLEAELFTHIVIKPFDYLRVLGVAATDSLTLRRYMMTAYDSEDAAQMVMSFKNQRQKGHDADEQRRQANDGGRLHAAAR